MGEGFLKASQALPDHYHVGCQLSGRHGKSMGPTQGWHGRFSGIQRRLAGAALALGAGVATVSLAALPAQAQNSSPLANPKANVPRTAAMTAACKDGPGATCQAAVVQAIDDVRASEGVKPLVLPAYYGSLTEAQQLLVLADLERVDRGLPGFTGLSSTLDSLAQSAAKANEDPDGPNNASWGSNWAGGEASALLADYDWMYDDGPGSPNLDCTSTDTSGCWAHRENVLGQYGPGPSMGAAVAQVNGVTSLTEIFASSPAGNLDFRLPSLKQTSSPVTTTSAPKNSSAGPKTAPVSPKAAPVSRKPTPVSPKVKPVAPQPTPVAPKPAPVNPKRPASVRHQSVQVTPRALDIEAKLGLPRVGHFTVQAPVGALGTTASVAGTGGRWTVMTQCPAAHRAPCNLVVKFLGLMPGSAKATVTVHLHGHTDHVQVRAFVGHGSWVSELARAFAPSFLTLP